MGQGSGSDSDNKTLISVLNRKMSLPTGTEPGNMIQDDFNGLVADSKMTHLHPKRLNLIQKGQNESIYP